MSRCLNYIDSPLPRCQLSRTGTLCAAGRNPLVTLPQTQNTEKVLCQRYSASTLSFAAFTPAHSFTSFCQAKNAIGTLCCEGRACVSRLPTCSPAPPPPHPPPSPPAPPPSPQTPPAPPPPWPLHPTAQTLDFSPVAASGVVLSSTSGPTLSFYHPPFLHCFVSFFALVLAF